ncbi:redoxin domain-containing protein [Agrobacterium rhizogenes]|nr:redoxin domain-containing protein [Rhizobium rhizogenes]
MPLQEKLDAFTADLIKSGKIPEPIVTRLVAGIQELVASGKSDRALKAGDVAPSFTLPDESGRSVSSVKLLGQGPLVISFYRGVWCRRPQSRGALQAPGRCREGVSRCRRSRRGAPIERAGHGLRSSRSARATTLWRGWAAISFLTSKDECIMFSICSSFRPRESRRIRKPGGSSSSGEAIPPVLAS